MDAEDAVGEAVPTAEQTLLDKEFEAGRKAPQELYDLAKVEGMNDDDAVKVMQG